MLIILTLQVVGVWLILSGSSSSSVFLAIFNDETPAGCFVVGTLILRPLVRG
jgi:hypothetical protein